MIVVNLFGAPGVSKSTGAAYIFSQLKMNNINCELVTEFAKDKVWEESKEVFNNQAYIFGKQYFRISRLQDKVDVVITDCPLLLSAFYNKGEYPFDRHFDDFVLRVFNSYNNMNYFLLRDKPYNPKGRFQTEEESNEVSKLLLEFLHNKKISLDILKGNKDNFDSIIGNIIERLNFIKSCEDEITSFKYDYAFLSNFYDCEIYYDCMHYKNSESAYQASKTENYREKETFCNLSGTEAKKLGRKVALRKDWEEVKLGEMEDIVRFKFKQNPDLAYKLLQTGDKKIVEGNYWHDNYWGNCYCDKCKNIEGENHLGKILMKIREELKG